MSLLDLVFPPRCAACGALLPEAAPLCATCAPTLLEVPRPSCAACGLPIAEGREQCERCLADPPPFAMARAAFAFEGAMAEAIPRFKYRDRPHLARPLVELAWPALRSLCEEAEVLAPMSLHPTRLRERGFDQALLLADELGRLAERPVEESLLERVRATLHQVGSSAGDRAENLRGAFRASPRARGRRVLLVDDVLTTTATARDAARALREAGATLVCVATLARAF